MASTPSRVAAFRGLNNVTDPVRLGLPWLTQADNVDVTASGALARRSGFTKAMPCVPSGVFVTKDQERLYVVDRGSLSLVHEDFSTTVLATGLTGPVHWAEFNEQVIFSCGADAGAINEFGECLPLRWSFPAVPTVSAGSGSLPAGQYRVCCTYVLADGRETGASDFASIEVGEGAALLIDGIAQLPGAVTRVYLAPADSTVFQHVADANGTSLTWDSGPEMLGMDLLTQGLDPLPDGVDCIAVRAGRLWASTFLQEENKSVIWRSEPLAPHLFDQEEGFFMVNGHVLALAPTDTGLVIGTDVGIHAYTAEGPVDLAPYGVVPGMPWAMDGKRLLIWSTRGLCQFPEFTNLTQRRVSVAPGIHAGAAVMEVDGQTRFIASLHAGGIAFNQRKEVSP